MNLIFFEFSFIFFRAAFRGRNKPKKKQLDKAVCDDIVDYTSKLFDMPVALVRGAITTKCADETKMMVMRTANNTPNQTL